MKSRKAGRGDSETVAEHLGGQVAIEKYVVQAELRDLFSPDIGGRALFEYQPDDPEDFSLLVEVVVGPAGQNDINEFFYLQICSPPALAREVAESGILWGRNRLVISRWDADLVTGLIVDLVERTRVLEWEFAVDYMSRYMEWAEERVRNPLLQ